MLDTLKRNVTTEEERYGGYRSNTAGTPTFDDYIRNDTPTYDRYAPVPTVERPSAPSGDYQRGREDYLWNRLNSNAAPQSYAQPSYGEPRYAEPTREGQRARYSPIRIEDKMPKVRHRAAGMSTQGKVILAVYLAVVILIATLIIVNAETINKGGQQTDTNTAAVENVYMPNDDGLYFAESPYNSTESETNWFDKLCDKLGG